MEDDLKKIMQPKSIQSKTIIFLIMEDNLHFFEKEDDFIFLKIEDDLKK